MSTNSTSDSKYVKSKVRPYFDENSLLLKALKIPYSIFNLVNVFSVTEGKSSFMARAYGYSTGIISKIWRVASWRALPTKELLDYKGSDESKVKMVSKDVIFGDDLASNFTFSCFRKIYLHFLEHNFLNITRESLELLRYESKVLRDVQDSELAKVLSTLFECNSYDDDEEKKHEIKPSNLLFTNMKTLVLTATAMVWRTLYERITYFIPIFGRESSNKDTVQEKCTASQKLENRNIFPSSSGSTGNTVSLSSGSLLLCESILTKTLTDSGTYALMSTQDMLKESLLLFVPMEILENTATLLKNSASLVSSSPLSAFWELCNYASTLGLNILEECYNQPDIEYAVIDDDDFHFVVNVPKMKRPILFIGIR